jgi:hypothetical protein
MTHPEPKLLSVIGDARDSALDELGTSAPAAR